MALQIISETGSDHRAAYAKNRYELLLATGLIVAMGCSLENRGPNSTATGTAIGKPLHVRTLLNVGKPVIFHPTADPPILLTGDGLGKLFLWDVRSGRRVATLMDKDLGPNRCAAFNPDGRLIASAAGVHVMSFPICCDLRLWDVSSGKTDRVLARTRLLDRFPEYLVDSVAFSPDGKLLAANGPEGQVNLYDVATGKLVRVLTGGKDIFSCLAYSPDGAQIAAVNLPVTEDNVYIWDVVSGKLVRTLRSSDGSLVEQATFSPDGKLLALASIGDNYIIDLWDRASGQYVDTFRGHTNNIHCVTFRPDSCWLASVSGDETLRLWDVRRRKLAYTLSLSGSAENVTFSPDGRWLAAQHSNESHHRSEVSVWDLGKDPTK